MVPVLLSQRNSRRGVRQRPWADGAVAAAVAMVTMVTIQTNVTMVTMAMTVTMTMTGRAEYGLRGDSVMICDE